MPPDLVRKLVLAALAVAGALALGCIYAFGQTRFFSIDEYQFGHATWLVSQGRIPYLEFFEHHFPLSYLLHGPFLWLPGDFASHALLLRKLVFASLAGAALVSGWCVWRVSANAFAGALAVFLPPSLGFGLMSAVDYRADGFAAFYLVAALSLAEWNRERARRGVAAVCGLLAFVAVGMTQKMLFVASATFGGMLAFDLARRLLGRGGAASGTRDLLARPAVFVGAAVLPAGLLLALGAGLGALGPAFEATVLQALEHERLYGSFSLFDKGWVDPFLRDTWASTAAVGLFALLFLVRREGLFWLFPVAASLLAASLLVAPYPYNFVLPCWLAGLAAVRGFANAVERAARRPGRFRSWAPVAYLLPLLVCADQLRFVQGRTSNDHQLQLLSRIERFGDRHATVIDNAGGAMFSPHASYYWYSGDAHRRLFADYFEDRLVDDYRDSAALFWIRDLRSDSMPVPVRDYLRSHYVSDGSSLFALGFQVPETEGFRGRARIDVVRPGVYHVHPSAPRKRPDRAYDLRIGGRPVVGNRIELPAGEHGLEALPWSPGYMISLLPPSFFDFEPSPHPHTLMFEYARPDPDRSAPAGGSLEE